MSKKSLYYVSYEQVQTYLEHHDHMCCEGYITDIINGEIDLDQLRKNILMYALEYGINTGMTVRRDNV